MTDALAACAGLSEQDLADVLALLAGTDILELELAFGGARVAIRRSSAAAAPLAPSTPVEESEPPTLAITSPLVGIFRPAVAEGDELEAGQAIGAIEALGLPTSVDAPEGGRIEELLVEDGEPVEYGQPLLVLRRSGT